MTPVARLLARVLPGALVGPGLAIVYAVMIVAIVLLGAGGHADIVYIDVNRP